MKQLYDPIPLDPGDLKNLIFLQKSDHLIIWSWSYVKKM